MSAEISTQPAVTGVGGWLIWPVANFALVILALLFFAFRHAGDWMVDAIAFAALSYCAATLVLTMKHAKAARYMFMSFYALLFVIAVFEFVSTLQLASLVPLSKHDLIERLAVEAVQGAIEVSTFLYLVFSKRVQQTFVS